MTEGLRPWMTALRAMNQKPTSFRHKNRRQRLTSKREQLSKTQFCELVARGQRVGVTARVARSLRLAWRSPRHDKFIPCVVFHAQVPDRVALFSSPAVTI